MLWTPALPYTIKKLKSLKMAEYIRINFNSTIKKCVPFNDRPLFFPGRRVGFEFLSAISPFYSLGPVTDSIKSTQQVATDLCQFSGAGKSQVSFSGCFSPPWLCLQGRPPTSYKWSDMGPLKVVWNNPNSPFIYKAIYRGYNPISNQ